MSELYDFKPLREYLEEKGIHVGEAEGYTPVTPDDVVLSGDGAIYFKGVDGSGGIFIQDKKGVEHQVFMYKCDYHLERYGKPRAHLCQCDTITDFMEGGHFHQLYRYANTEEVPVRNMDNYDEEEIVRDLPLCKSCRRLLNNSVLPPGSTSIDFVNILKAAGEDTTTHKKQQTQEVDIFGYVKNWEKISKAYRTKQDFTCEKCGYHATTPMERRFLQVHHIDGDKLNNQESNLQCLCICCHANVDDAHSRNFADPTNYAQLEDFLRTSPVIVQFSKTISGEFSAKYKEKNEERIYKWILFKTPRGDEFEFPLVVPFYTSSTTRIWDVVSNKDIYLVTLDNNLKSKFAFIKKNPRDIKTTNDIFPTVQVQDYDMGEPEENIPF